MILSLFFVNNKITDQKGINDSDTGVMVQQEIVTFQQGADLLVASKPAMTVDRTMLTSAHEARVHGLLDFLQRPVRIANLSFVQGVGPNILLGATLPHPYVIDFPYYIWQQPMWVEKLKGFRFLRMDLNFMFLVNGSPFDSGRLWFFWSPFDDERNDRRPFKTRTNCTGYPGVEVDIGNQMTSELKIPYVSMFTHIDQRLAGQPYGSLRCMVLSPLLSTVGSNTAEITIYCHLSNVDLSIPTDIPTLGSGVLEVAQMDEGKEKVKQGLISGPAKTVGQIAKVFANVPVLGDIAKPISWVADATAGVASLLGFSKPGSLALPVTTVPIPAKGFTHTDGLFNGVTLAAKPDNEIKPSYLPFGTEIDEMNMTNVCSRSNMITSFPVAITDPSLKLLYKLAIHPGICGDDTLANTAGYSTTHMSFVASMFRFWRGGVTIRFTAIKNAYYSGRLIFIFYPGVKTGDLVDYNTFDVSKCYQWIWDLKRDSDLELTVPYQSQTQFLRVRLCNNSTQDGLTTDTIGGTLACFIDNQLRAPSSAPPTLNIGVWVKGAHDLTFGVPDMVRHNPTDTDLADLWPDSTGSFTRTQLTKQKKNRKKYEVAQMMSVEDSFLVNQAEFGKENPEGSSLLKVITKESLVPEMHCIGELHNNLRPLTRRMCPAAFNINYTSGFASILDPAYYFGDNGSNNLNNPTDYISRIYVFYRGSMRYMARVRHQMTTTDQTPPASLDSLQQVVAWPKYWAAFSMNPVSTSPSSYFIATGQSIKANFRHFQATELNPIIEVTLPYYSNVPIQLISKVWTTNTHLRMIYAIGPDMTFNDPSGRVSYDLYKSAGDDHSFGYMVGAPMVQDTGS